MIGVRRETDTARRIVKSQIDVITKRWDVICTEARLSVADRRYFWQRQFLNSFAFDGLPASLLP